ncbi:hypothetical protein D3C77_391850 [compost metagenome]
MAFPQICYFCRIIIHLRINIQMIVTAPPHTASLAVIPYALQIHRQRRIRPRAGDGQIAAILQKQGEQLRIIPLPLLE